MPALLLSLLCFVVLVAFVFAFQLLSALVLGPPAASRSSTTHHHHRRYTSTRSRHGKLPTKLTSQKQMCKQTLSPHPVDFLLCLD